MSSSSSSTNNAVAIHDVIQMDGTYQFTLSNIPVCYANALRRTVLSDIPICVVRTETEEVNQCKFEANTTRFHNEILKQRLSCIPIHIKDLEMLPGKYVLELDVQNNTDEIMYVTTEQFRIKNKETGNYTTKEQTREIFPADPITHDYIDFCRLRPKISDTIPGEHVKFTAEFSVATAKVNSMFNVVSKCTYRNTQDKVESDREWKSRALILREKYATMTEDEIEFEKRNFELLDAERYFKPNSFDYSIQTLGIYDNNEVMKKACIVLQNKLVDVIQSIAKKEMTIRMSETTMEHCYDIILEQEDYTLGKIMEHVVYENYYVKDKGTTVSFCGFKKMHPHFTESVLRIAFATPVGMDQIQFILSEACKESEQKMKQIYDLFPN